MKNKCAIFILLAIVLNVSVSLVQPEFRIEQETTATPQEETWALLVGIDNYEDAAIMSLRYATADVKAFHEAIIDPSVGRFNPEHVYLMTDKETGRNTEVKITP